MTLDELAVTIPAKVWDKMVDKTRNLSPLSEDMELMVNAYISGVCDALELDPRIVFNAVHEAAQEEE